MQGGSEPRARTTVVVPTLGRSPLLAECLEALARQSGAPFGGGPGAPPELVVVLQGERPAGLGATAGLGRWLRVPRPLGFAAATNLGIATAETPYVAALNDDAVVEPGWLASLEAALDAAPDVAAVQGVNLLDDGSGRADGWGLGWNRAFQAVQLGRGEPPPSPGEPVREVFGVSATAALYRREALDAVAGPPRREEAGDRLPPELTPPPQVFDSRLVTYYEDADLAWRLRHAGYRSLSVPAARARHRGSATAEEMGTGRWRLVYGNRYLVLAGLFGRRFWARLPRLAARDVVDLARAAARGDLGRCRGVVGGWGRAARHLPRWVRRGPAALADEVILARAEGA